MEAIYLNDSYLKELEAEVVSVKDDKFVILDKTAFYPNGGGQPHDTGVIVKDGEEFNVVFVGKFDGKISHEVDKSGLEEGDKVICKLDWERRYKHMKMHTTAHILCEVLFRETGALITGNQIGEDKTRIDFDLENYDREKIDDYIAMANEIIEKDLEVTVKFLPREEAMRLPQVSKLAMGLPESIQEVRIVSIGDFDIQADGGTHIKSTKEIGKVKLLKVDNRGKNNRRIYFTLEEIENKPRIVLSSGYFDPLHVGHIEYLRLAKGLGDKLIVILNTDQQAALKKAKAFMPHDERKIILESLEFVDEVFVSIDNDKSVCESIRALADKYNGHEVIFSKGGDRFATEIPEAKICQDLRIKMVDGLGNKIQSSSDLTGIKEIK